MEPSFVATEPLDTTITFSASCFKGFNATLAVFQVLTTRSILILQSISTATPISNVIPATVSPIQTPEAITLGSIAIIIIIMDFQIRIGILRGRDLVTRDSAHLAAILEATPVSIIMPFHRIQISQINKEQVSITGILKQQEVSVKDQITLILVSVERFRLTTQASRGDQAITIATVAAQRNLQQLY